MGIFETRRIDQLNLLLMLLAVIAAILLPFWLFIVSYAVLGPLHYLTEIGWLKKRQFFTTSKTDFLPLVFIVVIWTGTFLFLQFFEELPGDEKISWLGQDWFARKANLVAKMNDILFAGLIGSIAMVFTHRYYAKLLALAGGFAAGIFLSAANIPAYTYAIGMLLPTLIHVYLFTGIFMLYGAMKSKSRFGFAGVVMLLLCAAACFIVPASPAFSDPGAIFQTYKLSGFTNLNEIIMNFGKDRSEWIISDEFLFSGAGIQLQRFIAFAYTYHYLNWFSKTSVIGWHKIPRQGLITVVVIWLFSLGLYFYDYRMGVKTLIFLSLLHVVLEFPLNVKSAGAIVQGIFARKAE